MFLLNPSESLGLSSFLQTKGWLARGEIIQQTERAGEGNMNCVVRVRTNTRSFILKQSRPWVEKYPQIAAPWDRSLIEARFYQETKTSAAISAHVPQLLAFDSEERLLMLEDLGQARELSGFYHSPEEWMREDDFGVLIHFLAALHTEFRDPALYTVFSNHAMRQLNHEHIFSLPLRRDNGLTLEAITPGLARLAEQLQSNGDYAATVEELGRLYLNTFPRACLLHGDYFPGSWMRVGEQVYVIDPEFCFYGPPEWDLSVMAAHLYLAGYSAKLIESVTERYSALAPLENRLTKQFAGVEIMRRLIGVAQLPLPYGLDRKRELLQTSVDLVLSGRVI
jgi:5-methylthioribose kinase